MGVGVSVGVGVGVRVGVGAGVGLPPNLLLFDAPLRSYDEADERGDDALELVEEGSVDVLDVTPRERDVQTCANFAHRTERVEVRSGSCLASRFLPRD